LTVHLGDARGVPEQTDHLFRLVGPFVSPVWHRAEAVTAVSRFVAGLASKAYGIESVVVPNGVVWYGVYGADPSAHSHSYGGSLKHPKSFARYSGSALIREMEGRSGDR
jgi:hypothetical protein